MMHWVYRCLLCQKVGSVPVALGTPVMKAAEQVAAVHEQFKPHCRGAVEIIIVESDT